MSAAARPSGDDGAIVTLSLLRERIGGLTESLRAASRCAWDAAANALTDDVAVTGVGASAGPARLFAWLLSHRSRRAARYVPPTAFARETPPAARTLVVFTQGLSPNAKLALSRADRYDRVVVITSAPPSKQGPPCVLADIEARGGVVVVVPPPSEEGLFLRVVGPATASLAAIAIAEKSRGTTDLDASISAALSELATAPSRALAAADHVDPSRLEGPLAIASTDIDPSALHGLRWKWLEGLRGPEPCGWDLLEIAHGPIQAAPTALPFVVLASAEDEGDDLRARLDRVAEAAGCPRIVLRSALPAPFSFLDHDAMLDALLLRVLSERPRDLRTGASAPLDEPLYGLGR